jgi:malonyl-CoA/methylmalonyl-CoA synthetase
MNNENLYWLMALASRRQHGATVFERPGDEQNWTYQDLESLTGRLAGRLISLDVEPGDRILVQVEKSPEAVALYLACLQVGAVFVPINTAYTDPEVDYFLLDAQPRLFVCRDAAGAADTSGVKARLPALNDNCQVLTLSDSGGGSLLADLPDTPRSEICLRRGDDLAAILYTSGTTGRSKGAMLSHSNLAISAVMLIDAWGWRSDDVLLHALPIFHVHGLFVALHCALLTGTRMIFLASFNAEEMVAQLPRATVMMGVPTFYTRMLGVAGLSQSASSNMRLFISGSAPLTEQTFAEWEARTGHRILERYGMSETMMNTSNPLVGERVPGTVGFPLPGVLTRIADDAGQELAAGEVGTLEVKGPNVFSGYWRMPEKTAAEFRPDGYFITGDLASQDNHGRITLVGRAKDLVISGGYNVYPKEVERLLDALPGVKESAVIGVPHEDFGEAVVAVLVAEGQPVADAEVAAALDGQLARFKQPKKICHVEELPRNAMGKVQKKQLRETFAELFISGKS